ncbi:hypothetical protein B0T26DRAFT_630990 [Lasiosphaeria miniovina]|uniref:G domain-containing protein n=1 Tax=Lasiosphaeria miniovina TaxID=1954250 RepID=A0AA40EDE0_9PEZI|nr:uncharacterized protein B0T26DRAFT_630990 [Lasiosphaeria miniovina]KAK0734257.1 hypothetical protein B0T26DRAFT_630990 [Lasiosphaeria miniovina]
MREGDAVIAVMGMTGSGKSTFISYFCDTAAAGHGLRSVTAQVEAHVSLILVDTPGFDDTTRSDTEVLREIASWLAVTYAHDIKLAGVVYLHGIQMPRVGGPAHTNMRLFRDLCGDESMASVALVTTHWSRSSEERVAQQQRYDELVSDDAFWRGMVQRGARAFKHDRGPMSARRIVEHLLGRDAEVNDGRGIGLRVQREIAGGATLDRTAVGVAIEARIEAMQAAYESQLGDLRRELDDARRATQVNERNIDEIVEERRALEGRLRDEQRKRRRLRVDLERLHQERSADLQREAENVSRMLEERIAAIIAENPRGLDQRVARERVQRERSRRRRYKQGQGCFVM